MKSKRAAEVILKKIEQEIEEIEGVPSVFDVGYLAGLRSVVCTIGTDEQWTLARKLVSSVTDRLESSVMDRLEV